MVGRRNAAQGRSVGRSPPSPLSQMWPGCWFLSEIGLLGSLAWNPSRWNSQPVCLLFSVVKLGAEFRQVFLGRHQVTMCTGIFLHVSEGCYTDLRCLDGAICGAWGLMHECGQAEFPEARGCREVQRAESNCSDAASWPCPCLWLSCRLKRTCSARCPATPASPTWTVSGCHGYAGYYGDLPGSTQTLDTAKALAW